MYVWRNTEARSPNHCCRGTAIVIKYYEFVGSILALVIRHAKRIFSAPLCFKSVGFLGSKYSSTLSHKQHDIQEKKTILIYIQQDATLHSLFYLENALHVSGGTTTHNQERKQMYLQHLVFVTPLLLPAAIAAGSSNGVTNTRCCRYSCLRS